MAAEIVLLFVGRTGNGKSSTANSVIGEKFFSTGKLCDEKSVEQTTTKEVDGFKMTVVDGTDIGDTGSDMTGGLQETILKTETAVQLCESGFNALIFVMTYGTRFTKQEKDAVDLIKSLFGRAIFKRFGIIVMTHGDQFDMDTEDDPKTFDQWCEEQTGDIRSLFQECDNRIVIFNNRSSNNDTLITQRQKLLKLVPDTKKYSLEDFNQASNGRHKLLIGHSFLEAEKQNKYFLEDIDQQIIRVMSKETKQRHKMLTNILSNVYRQMETVQKTFEGSEYYNSLWTPLQTRFLNVRSQLRKVEAGRSENTGDEKGFKTHSVDLTDNQPYRNLPLPSRPLSYNILPSDSKSTPIDVSHYSHSPQELPAAIHQVKDHVLLLVGRTGIGKSLTANSIIGEKVFGKKEEDSSLMQKNAVDIEGSRVTVVDGTGIGDTGSDMNGDIQDIIQKAETAVQLCESGFNALIFVLTYGTRFTKQEKDAVDLIKSLFGKDIFRRFGIIVMTRGDQFEKDTEDDPKTFDQWCEEQTGDITSLFQECDYRLALFDNKTEDTEILSRQRHDLLKFVQPDKRYSAPEFTEAEKDRKDICLLQEFPKAAAETKSFLKNIDSKLKSIKSMKAAKDRIELLNNCFDEVNDYEQCMLKKYTGYNFAQGLLNNLSLKKMELDAKRRNELFAITEVAPDERTRLLRKDSAGQADRCFTRPGSEVPRKGKPRKRSKGCGCTLF